MLKQIYKNWLILKNMHLRENRSWRNLLCSPSTTQHNFCFFKIRIFENYMSKKIPKFIIMALILKNMHLRENCLGRNLLCSPSTTFVFFRIRILENYMFKQSLKFIIMHLFWTICISEKNVQKDIYCARLAQLSTTFIFSKFTFLKIICLNKFPNSIGALNLGRS